MKIILLRNIPKLGNPGEIKDVAPIYARNVLFKSKLAVPATPDNLQKAAAERSKTEKTSSRKKWELEKLAQRLNTLTLVIKAKASDQGKLFAGLTTKKIAAQLKIDHSIDIDPSQLILTKPIKATGNYELVYELSTDLTGQFKLVVSAAT